MLLELFVLLAIVTSVGVLYYYGGEEESITPSPQIYVSQNIQTTTPRPTTLNRTALATTTLAPTRLGPTTLAPTTLAPTTLAPTTLAPTTLAPTTLAPTTLAPTTLAPTTLAPTTLAPTTLAPTTLAPTTLAPTTLAPTTLAPTHGFLPIEVDSNILKFSGLVNPTLEPTALATTTLVPTTLMPTTLEPTTLAPTTLEPTTLVPTTLMPTTLEPTTLAPTTLEPTTLVPTTLMPTTLAPTTLAPTTLAATTLAPTTLAATTLAPTTLMPTTLAPTTLRPTTLAPTTLAPTTLAPTTLRPTTLAPTTLAPTTLAPTTLRPTTLAPTTLAPTTLMPTTLAPTTLAPTTLAPTTLAPTTLAPTTLRPTTLAPTTLRPTTLRPTTLAPTTLRPTTLAPTTLAPTTLRPTTLAPTTRPTYNVTDVIDDNIAEWFDPNNIVIGGANKQVEWRSKYNSDIKLTNPATTNVTIFTNSDKKMAYFNSNQSYLSNHSSGKTTSIGGFVCVVYPMNNNSAWNNTSYLFGKNGPDNDGYFRWARTYTGVKDNNDLYESIRVNTFPQLRITDTDSDRYDNTDKYVVIYVKLSEPCNTITLGCSGGVGTRSFMGYIGDFICLKPGHTENDVIGLENFLINKWNVPITSTATLDSGEFTFDVSSSFVSKYTIISNFPIPIMNFGSSFTGLRLSLKPKTQSGQPTGVTTVKITWESYKNKNVDDGLTFNSYGGDGDHKPYINITKFGKIPLSDSPIPPKVPFTYPFGNFYEFRGKISAPDRPSIIHPNLAYCFASSTITSIDNINKWDLSKVKNMQGMFSSSQFNLNIADWNVSNVTNMREMFHVSYFNQPIGKWNVSQVTDMEFMFTDGPFNQPIGEWNVSKVTTMESMFLGCKNFNQPLNNWNVSGADTRSMFVGASAMSPSYKPTGL